MTAERHWEEGRVTPSDPRDRYRIESLLGRGGMGEVYKAFDPVLDRTVALKTISSISEDPLLLQRLYIEARACGRLAHPNIVRVYDLHESASAVYISMEYLEGESLAAAMERGSLPLAHKQQILDEILSALHYAHTKNVIHRDVKPSNVHLLPDGHIKLLDFGLARMTVGPTMTMAGAVMGTAPYMSPEQLKAQVVDPRTDIYSTGVLAYELLTGHRAFDGENITAVMLKVLSEFPAPIDTSRLGVPPEIAHVVNRAMSKSPDDRYSSAGEMQTALAACAPRQASVSERWSVTSAPTQQADATKLIPGREEAVAVAANEGSVRVTVSDPIGGLLNAPRPAEEKRTAATPAAPTAERSPSERMMSMLGPRATSIIGVAVLLIAFSLVWAITQLFLSPGTSASDRPSTSAASTTDGIPRPGTSDKVTRDDTQTSVPPVIEPLPPSPSVAQSVDGTRSGVNQGNVATATNVTPSQSTLSTAPSQVTQQTPIQQPTQTQQTTQGQQATQSRTQMVSAAANNDLSKALADRVRDSLRQAGYAGRESIAVSLEMSTRPAPFNGTNGITGDYVASVRTASVSRRVEGHVLDFGEVTLRNAVLDRAAGEVVAIVTGTAPER